MNSVVRTMGLIGVSIFLALSLAVVLLVATEGNNSMPRLAVVIGPPIIGGVIYLSGLASPGTLRARNFRIGGWFGMALALYGLISFSFLVVPLLAVMVPAAFASSPRPTLAPPRPQRGAAP